MRKKLTLLLLFLATFQWIYAENVDLVIQFPGDSAKTYSVDDIQKMDFNDTLTIIKKDGSVENYLIENIQYIQYTNAPPAFVSGSYAPADSAANQSVNPVLSWSCQDTDQDTLYYSIYMGADSSSLSLIGSAVTDTFYQVSSLEYNTQYFWKITATDLFNTVIESPALSFVTLPPDIRFTRKPAIPSVSETDVVIKFSTDLPVICSLSYSSDQTNWVNAEVSGTLTENHLIHLKELTLDTQYEYKLYYYFQTGGAPIDSSETRTFSTLARQIEKIIQLAGTPKSIEGQTQIAVTFETDQPVLGVCKLYNSATDTLSLEDSIQTIDHLFTFTGLEQGTQYQFQVGAKDPETGEIFYLEARYTATTAADTISPIVVSGPSVTVSDDQAVISFNLNEFCQSQMILTKTQDQSVVDTLSIEELTKKHQYTLIGLEPGISYDYALWFEDQAGNQAQWGSGGQSLLEKIGMARDAQFSGNSFTTNSSSDIAPPRFLTLPNQLMVYDSLAIIQWSTNEQSRYLIEIRNPNNSLIFYRETEEYCFESIAMIARLEPGTQYTAYITAIDIEDNRSDSSSVVFTTRRSNTGSGGYQAEITQSLRTYVTSNYAVLTWGTNIPCVSYANLGSDIALSNLRVYYETNDMSRYHIVVMNGLSSQTGYYYQTESRDLFLNQLVYQGQVDSFSTGGQGAEETLAFSDNLDTLFTADSIIKISWSTNLLSFGTIQYHPSGDTLDKILMSAGELTKEHSFVITGLCPNTEYKIKTYSNTIDEQSISDSLMARTQPEGFVDEVLPELSEEIVLELDSVNGYMKITWQPCADPDFSHYNVYRNVNESGFELLAGNLRQTEYIDDNYDHSSQNSYQYGITAVDYFGNECDLKQSNSVVKLDEGFATETQSIYLSQNYPNPFNQTTSIELSVAEPQKAELIIYDILGKVIWQRQYVLPAGEKKIERISTGTWPAGIYFYQLKAEKGSSQVRKMLYLK